jgi:hypothetical protein
MKTYFQLKITYKMKPVISFLVLFCLLSGYQKTHGNVSPLPHNNITYQSADTIRDTSRITQRDTIVDSTFLKGKNKEEIRVILNTLNQVFGIESFSQKDTIPLSKIDTATRLSILKKFIQQDSVNNLYDTIRPPLKNLLWHSEHPPLDSSIAFLQKYFQQDTIIKQIKDTAKFRIIDSLYSITQKLIQTTRKDSIEIILVNSKNDSVSLWLKTTDQKEKSKRLVLYDEREVPAGVWIEPHQERTMKIELDKNTLIEKTEPQKNIIQDLPTEEVPIRLKKYKHIDMVFPQWDIGGIGTLDFNQGYYSNWVAGGENNLNALLDIDFNIDYKKGKTIWDNDFEYKAGMMQSGKTEGIRKNEDILEINSKYGTNANKDWYYSALINFKTQLFKGYEYPNDSVAVSGFLAPAYTVFSIGMDYKPSDKLTILASPISSKITMMRRTDKFKETKYGLNENQSIKKEIGAYVKSIFNIQLHKNIHMQNKINLFTNYLNNPENVDIDWEISFDMKITEYIQTSFSSHIKYDDDVEIPVYEKVDGEKTQVGVTKKIQFKEVLSVGLSYRF